jgi:hypothetical protein
MRPDDAWTRQYELARALAIFAGKEPDARRLDGKAIRVAWQDFWTLAGACGELLEQRE